LKNNASPASLNTHLLCINAKRLRQAHCLRAPRPENFSRFHSAIPFDKDLAFDTYLLCLSI